MLVSSDLTSVLPGGAPGLSLFMESACIKIPDDNCTSATTEIYIRENSTSFSNNFTPYLNYYCTECKDGFFLSANKCY